MDLPDYLRFVAARLEQADRVETLRLIRVLQDTLNDVIAKIEVQNAQGS